MRRLAAAAFVASLTAVGALGQAVPSAIIYTLELGGDNHVADWENAGGLLPPRSRRVRPPTVNTS